MNIVKATKEKLSSSSMQGKQWRLFICISDCAINNNGMIPRENARGVS
jgi:hypothetical protein